MAEQRPFKPLVVGSTPTAPTTISFLNCELQICEGALGSSKLTLRALVSPTEPPCYWPPAEPWESHACRYSSWYEYRHDAAVPVAP